MQLALSHITDLRERGKALIAKHDSLIALCITVAVIVLGVSLGLRNDNIVPIHNGVYGPYPSSNPLRVLANWDGRDYIHIARHGYQTLLDAGFFPLYPLLIKVFQYLVRSYLMSALIISWVSVVGAVYCYIKIIRHLGLVSKKTNLALAVAPFILFPSAAFMIVTYTEGLFAFLALASIYYALKQRPVLSGIFILLACLTHVTGAFLIVINALIMLEEQLPIRRIAAAVLIGSSGLLILMGYMFMVFHNPLAFLKSQTKIHGWLSANYYTLLARTTYLNMVFVVLIVVAAMYYWHKRRSFSIYTLLFLLIPLIGAQWGGFNRYVLMAFPIPIMLFDVFRKKQVYVYIVVLTSIFWTYILLQYAAGYISS